MKKIVLLLLISFTVTSCDNSKNNTSEKSTRTASKNVHVKKRGLDIEPVAKVSSDKRIALIIGNSDYKNAPLKNPVNDANDMAELLGKLNFDVTIKTNAQRVQMRRAIRDFGDILKKGGIGLFFYAGHGMQINGRNYLIPIGADIQREDEVQDSAINAGLVLRKMQSAGNRMNMVFLDACRDNPFARSFRSSSKGLAQMDAPSGSLIVYATAPGDTAADGKGRNGVFTQHLLKYVKTPGIEIGKLLRHVRVAVEKETKGKQVPWESSSLKGDFYFAGDKEQPKVVKAPEIKNKDFMAELKRWDQILKQMKSSFKQINQSSLAPGIQREAWKRFAKEYGVDNPYSKEDNALLKKAANNIQELAQKIAQQEQERKRKEQLALALKKKKLQEKERKQQEKLRKKKLEEKKKRKRARKRFEIAANGVISDNKTGLEWYVGPDVNATSYKAKKWIKSLKVDGGGWRFPSIDELKSIYQKGTGSRNMDPVFKTTGWLVWGPQKSPTSVWFFDLHYGYDLWDHNNRSDGRVFAVRFGRR